MLTEARLLSPRESNTTGTDSLYYIYIISLVNFLSKHIRGNLYDICLLHEEKSLRDSNHHIARFQPSGHMSLRDDIMVAYIVMWLVD